MWEQFFYNLYSLQLKKKFGKPKLKIGQSVRIQKLNQLLKKDINQILQKKFLK
jgi:hypothetical protein